MGQNRSSGPHLHDLLALEILPSFVSTRVRILTIPQSILLWTCKYVYDEVSTAKTGPGFVIIVLLSRAQALEHSTYNFTFNWCFNCVSPEPLCRPNLKSESVVRLRLPGAAVFFQFFGIYQTPSTIPSHDLSSTINMFYFKR